MAGSYNDVPAPRIPYDRDGSSGTIVNGSTVTLLTPAQLQTLNDEDADYVATPGSTSAYVAVIFANKYDVKGWHASWDEPNSGADLQAVEWSTNTTNGQDGTWTVITSSPHSTGAVRNATRAQARQSIHAVDLAGCKAIRFRHYGASTADSTRFQWAHFYGNLTAGEAPNRLRFVQPAAATELTGAYFDWGDMPRNGVATKTFRLHNPSALTAQSVTLTTEALTDTTPSNAGQHTYSLDGTTFTASLNVGDIGPGGYSPVVTVKRTAPSDAPLSVWFARIVASAAAYV